MAARMLRPASTMVGSGRPAGPERDMTMARSNRGIRLAAVAAATALAVSACGNDSGDKKGGTSSGPIKIGVPVPLSGDYASAGQDIVNGAKLAVNKINGDGGVLGGRKIELVPVDDACSAQVGAQAAQKLISGKVAAVAGGYCSSASLPELSAFHRAGIPFVMDASSNPQLTEQGFAEAIRVIGRDDQQGPFVSKFISGFLKAGTAAVIHDNTTYAKGLSDATVKALKSDGVNVVFNNAVSPGQSDYTPVLTRVRGVNPDVVYYTGYYAEAALIVKQGKSLGLKTQFIGGDATNDPTLIKTAGAAAEGMIVDTAPLAQFLGSEGKRFVEDYQKLAGAKPGPYSVYEYDSVNVVAKAIEKAGSADPKKITQALRGISHTGITGKISFDEKGDRANPVYITLIVKNGEFTPYKRLDEQGQWVDVPAVA